MPGSMTISHTHALVMLSHTDADRLAAVLREMSAMATAGADRLSEAQVEHLGKGKLDRTELAEWCETLSTYLTEHL